MRAPLHPFVSRRLAAFGLAVFGLAAAGLASVGTPALAQPVREVMDAQLRAGELQAQQDLAARQAVLQQNQLAVLEAQIRAQQAITDIQAQSRTPQLAPQAGGLPNLDVSQLASIPDDVLAASNARVKAAAANHH